WRVANRLAERVAIHLLSLHYSERADALKDLQGRINAWIDEEK
ncbi:hypothetical protein LCGC14_2980730, partial [marine sediment metagenome]